MTHWTLEIEAKWWRGEDIRPSQAHLDAWARAVAKIEGRAPYQFLPSHTLPEIALRWDDANLPPGAAAETAIFGSGLIVVVLRSTLPVAEVHRNALHELQHCLDRELMGRLPLVTLEWRADSTAERLWRL